jgi:hypothetical protein
MFRLFSRKRKYSTAGRKRQAFLIPGCFFFRIAAKTSLRCPCGVSFLLIFMRLSAIIKEIMNHLKTLIAVYQREYCFPASDHCIAAAADPEGRQNKGTVLWQRNA